MLVFNQIKIRILHVFDKSFSRFFSLNRLLITNALWSISGSGLPLVFAIICIPFLITSLGEDGFGFLAIAWMIVGYLSLFDFGIGRAITYTVSKDLATKKDPSSNIITGLVFLLGVGVVVGCILYQFSYLIIETMNILEDKIGYELGLKTLSFGVPIVILTAGLKGVLEAFGKFRVISLISIPTGSLMFVLPSIVCIFSTEFVYVFSSLVLVRAAQGVAFLVHVLLTVNFQSGGKFSIGVLRHLLSFGGWLTISNIVSPLMAYMDRFFIGSSLGLSNVSFYVVPFDMISKVLIFPTAILSVLFPDFTKSNSSLSEKVSIQSILRPMLAVFILLSLPLATLYLFSLEIMTLWIGDDFAGRVDLLVKILCFGFLINSIAYVPYGFIQSFGRSDVTAKLHLTELIIYIPTLIFLINNFGIVGAALAWTGRVFLDFVLLLVLSRKLTL